MGYGIPYMGSKSGIVDSIALNFPKAENFYDLFGGGFSVSHYMIQNKFHQYKNFHYNEIKSDVVELVKKAIYGDFNYNKFKPDWISRDEFFARKDTDAYVRCLWSFGNDQSSYLFSKEVEPYKKSMHKAIVFEEFDELATDVLGLSEWPKMARTITQRRIYLRQKITHYRCTKVPNVLQHLQRLERLERLQQLQQLERLQRLERLQQLEQVSMTSLDYRQVEIHQNSVVYCDIPYIGTKDYLNAFSHKDFFDWAINCPHPVFFSEYKCDDPRFKLIYSIGKLVNSSAKGPSHTKEKLFWNGK